MSEHLSRNGCCGMCGCSRGRSAPSRARRVICWDGRLAGRGHNAEQPRPRPGGVAAVRGGDRHERGIAICRETGDRHGEGQTLDNLASAYQEMQQPDGQPCSGGRKRPCMMQATTRKPYAWNSGPRTPLVDRRHQAQRCQIEPNFGSSASRRSGHSRKAVDQITEPVRGIPTALACRGGDS